MSAVRAFIETTNAAGNKSIEAEQQLALEGELLLMLETQLAAEKGSKIPVTDDAP